MTEDKKSKTNPIRTGINDLAILKQMHRPKKTKQLVHIDSIEFEIVEDNMQKIKARMNKMQEDIEGIQSGIEQFLSNVECELENIVAYNCHLSELHEDLNKLKTEIADLNSKKG